MKELIERLREDYCSCIDGYKSRGMTDPQCSSCDSKDWREECADALERMVAEKKGDGQTIAHQMEENERLTAERDALRADAERYRFIRKGTPDIAVMSWVNGIDDWVPWADEESVDEAIDAAIGETK